LLQLNGRDLKSLPIEERKVKLAELLRNSNWRNWYSVSFTKDIDELLGKAKELGLEGLIGKRSGSRYEVGRRSGAWLRSNCTWSKSSSSVHTPTRRIAETFRRTACRIL
jgi:bifunctional non-homologous end joining protein LigD